MTAPDFRMGPDGRRRFREQIERDRAVGGLHAEVCKQTSFDGSTFLEEAPMRRATLVCAAMVLTTLATVRSQDAPRPDGWVVISVDDYRALRLRAYPPERPPETP